jgi:hypothetical protein
LVHYEASGVLRLDGGCYQINDEVQMRTLTELLRQRRLPRQVDTAIGLLPGFKDTFLRSLEREGSDRAAQELYEGVQARGG